MAAGKPVWENRPRRQVTAVAFAGDGKTLLTGDADWNLWLWDAATGERTTHVDNVARFRAVAYGPGDRLLAAGNADLHTAQVWAAATRERLGPPLPHRGPVTAVTFTPDGRSLVTGSEDGTARVWAVAAGTEPAATLRHPSRAFADSVTFSPDGTRLLTADRGETAQLWDVRTAAPVGRPFRHYGRVLPAFSPDGRLLLTGGTDGSVQLRAAADGTPVGPEPLGRVGGPVRRLAVSGDGRTALAGTRDADGTVQLYDLAGRRPLATFRHAGFDRATFAADGRSVVTVAQDGSVRRWEAATGVELGSAFRHPTPVGESAVSPDGRLVLLTGRDGPGRLYRVADGEPIGPPLAHEGEVWWAGFSPDGRRAVTCGADRTARVWESATGRAVGVPMAHRGPVYEAAFSPDGRLLVTGSADGTVRLWDAATGKRVGPALRQDDSVHAVAFSPAGDLFAASSADQTPPEDDHTTRLWKVPPVVGGDVARVVRWVEVVTGLELGEGDVVRRLDVNGWPQRRRALAEAGGPPLP